MSRQNSRESLKMLDDPKVRSENQSMATSLLTSNLQHQPGLSGTPGTDGQAVDAEGRFFSLCTGASTQRHLEIENRRRRRRTGKREDFRGSPGIPGSVRSMAVQKKQGVIPPSQGPLSARTTDSRRVGNRSERTRENVKPDLQTKKISSPVLKHNQICNSDFSRATPAGNGLNVDERLKAARERREEHQRLLASRERSRLEREQQAKRYHEQQLQERRKKLLEQRLKEERRRAAVEEKRKQRLREEKERHESAVRKTLERSHKVQQQLNQNSRGRKLTKTVPRGLPLTTWEKNLVSRLLTPTCSYLARSKSTRCQTGEVVHVCHRAVSHHSMNTPTPTISHKHQPGSVNHRPPASSSSNTSQHTSISPAQTKVARQQDSVKKNSNRGSGTKLSAENVKQATSTQIRTTSTSPERSPQRSVSRHLTPLQLELSSVPEEDAEVCASAGNTRPVRGPERGQREKLRPDNSPQTPCSSLSGTKTEDWTGTATHGSPPHSAPEVLIRSSAGSSDLEKASRLLAEKRREARLQREKEKQERLQREEAERRSREESEYRRAEEQAEQEAEVQRLVEEKRRREEEEQRRAEEERAQAMKEAALLLKQREEELAKERAQAEQMKKERETAAHKEEAERQARKKRLEEIMRRTRRTDSPDTTSVAARVLPNEALPKENTAPVHNGTIEDGVKLPAGAKTTQLVLNNEPDVVPVVAFKDRRSLRALSGLEEIQTQQRAEVI
ncbi:ensconsin-like [Nematolebias whitei]|uniref:ensconsin-like n=1 Tax=Nematolebias whitei TaxID=451745 RepID=UPI001897EF15|nr:ensconsin-like [Nematolebias whitei]